MDTPAAIAFPKYGTLIAAAVLCVAGFAAYANSLGAPFIFDDRRAILDNPSIRQLWPLSVPLSPPATEGSGVAGRPLLNLSFALNYATGGTSARGYHRTNTVIHVLAALALFGLVRRTLVAWRPEGRPAAAPATATWLALAIAGLWVVHPLQTESVTSIVQRTESLFGLLFLTCFYCCVRAATAASLRLWGTAAVLAAFAGVATKEVMVTIPVLVLLHDRTFLAGSFAEAWRRRKGLYLGLLSSWLLLAWLLAGAGGSRGQAAGFGLGVTPWSYALTQCEAIATYLWLSLWPANLILDYGTGVVGGVGEVLPEGLLVLALVGFTAWALWRRPAAGFLGAWFLVILSPSSSFVPLVGQTIAEHRMYLPLAALVAAAVWTMHQRLGPRALMAAAVLAVGLGWRTIDRNRDYATEISIWSDTVAKRPGNARALTNLGNALLRAGRVEEGIGSLREALRVQPDFVDAHSNLGGALSDLGRWDEAAAALETAVRLDPGHAAARHNLGNVRVRTGRFAEGAEQFREAVRLDPARLDSRQNLGLALYQSGRRDEGLAELRELRRLHPEFEPARVALEALGVRP